MKKIFFVLLLTSTSLSARTPSKVLVGTKVNHWTQAGLAVTNNLFDLAIQGSGFFMVEDQAGFSCFTRRGRFELSPEGYLHNKELKMDLVTIVQGEKLQRLQINDIGYLNDSPLISIRVSLDGSITAFYKNGLDRKIGRIALALFQNQRRLERSGSHCLLPTEGSGDPYLDYVHVDGRGSLYGSSLEEVDEHIYSLALDDAH